MSIRVLFSRPIFDSVQRALSVFPPLTRSQFLHTTPVKSEEMSDKSSKQLEEFAASKKVRLLSVSSCCVDRTPLAVYLVLSSVCF